MAKGQNRPNREVRKPKKSAGLKAAGQAGSAVTTAFAPPAKSSPGSKKR
ncbi:MAG: hypothetical protein ABL907_03385 [Hyphomicrobium sp.]